MWLQQKVFMEGSQAKQPWMSKRSDPERAAANAASVNL